jgi:hydroxymethylpyrimidine pyrophosphatase-like HAD family hydrolase
VPPRLVATDLDGTLVGADGLVSARTAKVLAAVDALGVPVVFVTARPLRWMGDIWPYVGRHSVGIVSNGAILYDPGAGRVIDITGIEPEVGQALLADLAEALPDAGLGLEYVSGLHRTVKYVYDAVPDPSTISDLRPPWPGPVAKMLVKDDSIPPEELRAVTAEIVGTRATPTWSVPGLVEISAVGVTKGWRLREVCASLGIDAADVVAFGDMPNDLEMLRWAGTSYAMANGHPSVRAAATHVASRNDEDGVARVLVDLYGLDPALISERLPHK